MRRFFVGLANIAMLGLVPCKARGNDRQIARQIVNTLEQHKANGTLTDFNIELEVEDGSVYLNGRVVNEDQERLALEVAQNIEGVRQVYYELEIAAGEGTLPQPSSRQGVRLASASDADPPLIAPSKRPKRANVAVGAFADLASIVVRLICRVLDDPKLLGEIQAPRREEKTTDTLGVYYRALVLNPPHR